MHVLERLIQAIPAVLAWLIWGVSFIVVILYSMVKVHEARGNPHISTDEREVMSLRTTPLAPHSETGGQEEPVMLVGTIVILIALFAWIMWICWVDATAPRPVGGPLY